MYIDLNNISDAFNFTDLNITQHLSKNLYKQFSIFKSDVESKKIEIVDSDIVLLMMGGNDLLMHENIQPLDFVNTQRNFIKSIFNMNVKHVVVTNLVPIEIVPEYKN